MKQTKLLILLAITVYGFMNAAQQKQTNLAQKRLKQPLTINVGPRQDASLVAQPIMQPAQQALRSPQEQETLEAIIAERTLAEEQAAQRAATVQRQLNPGQPSVFVFPDQEEAKFLKEKNRKLKMMGLVPLDSTSESQAPDTSLFGEPQESGCCTIQ